MEARTFATSDPKSFIEAYPPPVFIDEVQYAPNLFSYIKMNVDKRKQNGDYWLSGSQLFKLMRGVNESLAGRDGSMPQIVAERLTPQHNGSFIDTTSAKIQGRIEFENERNRLYDSYVRIYI